MRYSKIFRHFPMSTPEKEPTLVDQYRQLLHHPLIDVLPPLPNDFKAMSTELEYLPTPPDDKLRTTMTPVERFCLTSMLRTLHVPSNRDVELAYRIDQLLRVGLQARPLTAEHYATAKERLAGFVAAATNAKSPATIQSPTGSLIARSGEGKSRACYQASKRYPQVILHDTRLNPLLPAKQVVIVHLECPSDRTVRSLMEDFIKKLEHAIGEKIPPRFHRGNRSTIISNMGELCETYWIGLIILDECQHALKNGLPSLELMNFLVEMTNKLKVPILFVGTPLAFQLIGGQLRQARRMMGIEWLAYKKDDPEWIRFLTKIWPYQFAKLFTPLDAALQSAIFEYSQGIPIFAIALYENVQRNAIGAGAGEEITVGHFEAVYNDHFKPVKPMIEALKSGDPARIEQFEDLAHSDEGAEWFRALSKLREELRNKAVKRVSNAHKRAIKQMVKSAQADAAAFSQASKDPQKASIIQLLLQAHQLGLDPAAIVKAFPSAAKSQNLP